MYELKPCPFCGSNAEMYTGRTYPTVSKSLCESEEAAKEQFERLKQRGTVVDYKIGKRKRLHGYKNPKQKWGVWVVFQGYIPRCTNPKCIGRSAIMFHTEAEAADAWNKRCSNV